MHFLSFILECTPILILTHTHTHTHTHGGCFVELSLQDLGNVHQDTDFSFSFHVRKNHRHDIDDRGSPLSLSLSLSISEDTYFLFEISLIYSEIDCSHLFPVPFQFQILFTSRGAKYMRVVSLSLPTTKEREVAEKEQDTAIVAIAGVQNVANWVEKGGKEKYTHTFC